MKAALEIDSFPKFNNILQPLARLCKIQKYPEKFDQILLDPNRFCKITGFCIIIQDFKNYLEKNNVNRY